MFEKPTTSFISWQQTKDEVLEKEIDEKIKNDKRLSNTNITVRVHGNVAHVEGNVATYADLNLIRNLLAKHENLYAVWDILTIDNKKPTIADIGCGTTKQVTDALGVDKIACKGVDVVTDLENPLPFLDNAFDSIFAIHVIEHIHNLVQLMNEMHRVLKEHGVLHVITPNWKFVNAVSDPTHVRFLDKQTIKYFCLEKQNINSWKPLSVKTTEDSIFADLQPIKHKSVEVADIARWFY